MNRKTLYILVESFGGEENTPYTYESEKYANEMKEHYKNKYPRNEYFIVETTLITNEEIKGEENE